MTDCNNCTHYRVNVPSSDGKAICSPHCGYNFRISDNKVNGECPFYKRIWWMFWIK